MDGGSGGVRKECEGGPNTEGEREKEKRDIEGVCVGGLGGREKEFRPGHTSGSRGNRTYAHVSCRKWNGELG